MANRRSNYLDKYPTCKMCKKREALNKYCKQCAIDLACRQKSTPKPILVEKSYQDYLKRT